MSSLKTLAIASALVLGASQLVFAQAGPVTGSPTSPDNAAASGGSGTVIHKGAMRSSRHSSNQKVMKNQSGY
jgi:hypothetical protein